MPLSLPVLADCLSPDILHLILLPTEACNFRCVYCYESFQYKRMDPAVVEGVKNLLTHRVPTLNEVSISWFGGEPLLATDIMTRILEHVRELREKHPQCGLSSDATTNGYLLTPQLLSRLAGLGMNRYQISFDGPRPYHDSKRVLAGGRGTYDRIWGNLLAIRDSDADARITVRVHVSRENVEAMPEFVREYEAAFGTDPRFEIFVRQLSRLGGPNDADLPILGGSEGTDPVQRIRESIRAKGLRQLDARPEGSICYAAKGNSFVVRSNGRVNKCTVALEHPMNQVGMLHPDGTIALDAPKVGGWLRGLESGDPGELRCPMHGYADPVPAPASVVGA